MIYGLPETSGSSMDIFLLRLKHNPATFCRMCNSISDYSRNKRRPAAVDSKSTAADPHEFLFYRTA
jgi:hypothetical protein